MCVCVCVCVHACVHLCVCVCVCVYPLHSGDPSRQLGFMCTLCVTKTIDYKHKKSTTSGTWSYKPIHYPLGHRAFVFIFDKFMYACMCVCVHVCIRIQMNLSSTFISESFEFTWNTYSVYKLQLNFTNLIKNTHQFESKQ